MRINQFKMETKSVKNFFVGGLVAVISLTIILLLHSTIYAFIQPTDSPGDHLASNFSFLKKIFIGRPSLNPNTANNQYFNLHQIALGKGAIHICVTQDSNGLYARVLMEKLTINKEVEENFVSFSGLRIDRRNITLPDGSVLITAQQKGDVVCNGVIILPKPIHPSFDLHVIIKIKPTGTIDYCKQVPAKSIGLLDANDQMFIAKKVDEYNSLVIEKYSLKTGNSIDSIPIVSSDCNDMVSRSMFDCDAACLGKDGAIYYLLERNSLESEGVCDPILINGVNTTIASFAKLVNENSYKVNVYYLMKNDLSGKTVCYKTFALGCAQPTEAQMQFDNNKLILYVDRVIRIIDSSGYRICSDTSFHGRFNWGIGYSLATMLMSTNMSSPENLTKQYFFVGAENLKINVQGTSKLASACDRKFSNNAMITPKQLYQLLYGGNNYVIYGKTYKILIAGNNNVNTCLFYTNDQLITFFSKVVEENAYDNLDLTNIGDLWKKIYNVDLESINDSKKDNSFSINMGVIKNR